MLVSCEQQGTSTDDYSVPDDIIAKLSTAKKHEAILGLAVKNAIKQQRLG